MNTSSGSEKIVFWRDAIAPARAAAAAAGFASPPAFSVRALAITICWFGQITSHTLRNITRPKRMPIASVGPAVLCTQKSLPKEPFGAIAMMSRPNTTVAAADQRNHQSARQVSLSNASLRELASISAYAGVCTKLKNHSRPIHMTATMTWAMLERSLSADPAEDLHRTGSRLLRNGGRTYQTFRGPVRDPRAAGPGDQA